MNPFEQEEAICMLIGMKKIVECGWKRVTFSGRKKGNGWRLQPILTVTEHFLRR